MGEPVGKKARGGAVAAAAGPAGSHVKLGKGTASLINKWQKVAQQVAQEEEEAAAAAEALEDPEARAAALEAQRMREAEEWRMQQLRTGAADDNANFAPVVGDWQQRVKHAKRQQRLDAAAAAAAAAVSGAEPAAAQATAAAAGSAAAAAAAGASRAGKPDLDALSEGLPSGWRAMWDATHARVYYGNIDTQVTQWERPG